jgi:GntR family transcriptional regulator/MocR family aminotransferase
MQIAFCFGRCANDTCHPDGGQRIEYFTSQHILLPTIQPLSQLEQAVTSLHRAGYALKDHLEKNHLVQFRMRRKAGPTPLFEVQLNLAAKGSRESARTLYRELRDAIVEGRLLAGARLPPLRQARTYFGVSRNTAAGVYEKLINDGYVLARQGSGTYVAERVTVPRTSEALPKKVAPDGRLNTFWLDPSVTAAIGFWREQPQSTAKDRHSRPVDFRPALADPRLFPFDVFRRVSGKQLRGLERKPASYKSPQGNQGHLLARTLVTRDETVVAIEDPGYPPLRIAFAAAAAKIVPIGVDDEGLIVEQLPRNVGAICVCPSHQFPLGMPMSARRRKSLVEYARNCGALIIEDDYDREFRHDASPLESLRASANADVVFYVGTFSKCMLPALRLGFIIAPQWALPTLIAAKNCLDWHCSTPIQSAVSDFIAEGHLTRHVRRMREIYKERRQLLLKFLRVELGDWLDRIPSCYGMHVAAAARCSLDFDHVTEALLRHDVKMHSFSRYFLGPQTRAGLIFGYGAADLSELKRGLVSLKQVLRRST